MDSKPQEALDHIRQQLQLILLRADLCLNPSHCQGCSVAVQEIVKEIRALEAFIRTAVDKNE